MLISQLSSGVSASTEKQITITNNSLASSVMYIVPSGRKFVGYIYNINNNYSTQINSINYYGYHGSATYVAQAGALNPVTLVAGTVIKEVTANSSYIIGVESDA